MYRLKGWCVEVVQKAVSVLVSSEEANEEQPKIIQLAAELEVAKKGHNGVAASKMAHICRVCNVACIQCVTLQGSSVDERGFHSHVSECSKANLIQTSIKTAEVSTQTEMLASNLEMTGLPQNTCLPDLLVTSSSSLKELPPPPPPPPPAPPLPLKFQTAGASSTLSVTKKHQNALKKSQSAGVAVAPEITVELLRKVKLRKLKELDKSHSNCSLTDMPAKVQPAVTLKALQKVTLRKTHSAKCIDLGARDVQPEASDCHECGSKERRAVQQHRKIETRSSSGPPLLPKRRRQLEMEQQSVQCKQRRQSVTNIRLLL